MAINWDEVFQKGADAFGEAVGTSLGGPVGGAIAHAILGGSEGNTQALDEINQTLLQIESKLSELIRFLQEELPDLIYQKATDAVVQQKTFDVLSARTGVHGALAVLRPPITEAKFAALQVASNGIAQLGLSIINNGPGWYQVAVNATCSAAMGYRRLIRHDQTYGQQLIGWADAYLTVLHSWMDASNPKSIPNQLISAVRSRDAAQAIADQIVGGDFVSSIFGPGPNDDGNGGYVWAFRIVQSDLRKSGSQWAATPRLPNGVLDYPLGGPVAYPDLAKVAALGTRVYEFWKPPLWPAYASGKINDFNDAAVGFMNSTVESIPRMNANVAELAKAKLTIEKLVNALGWIASPSKPSAAQLESALGRIQRDVR